MQVSAAVRACLEYHQANSGKKYGQWLSFRTRSIQKRIWSQKNREYYLRGNLFLSCLPSWCQKTEHQVQQVCSP
jgi:hypothetical protein